MEWGKRQGLGFFELRRQSTLLYYALFCRHGLCYSDYWLYIRFAGVLRSTFYCKHEKVLPKMVNTAVRLVRIQDRCRSISYLTFLSFAIAWEGNKSNLKRWWYGQPPLFWTRSNSDRTFRCLSLNQESRQCSLFFWIWWIAKKKLVFVLFYLNGSQRIKLEIWILISWKVFLWFLVFQCDRTKSWSFIFILIFQEHTLSQEKQPISICFSDFLFL